MIVDLKICAGNHFAKFIGESVFLLGKCQLVFEFSIVCYKKIADFSGIHRLTKTQDGTLLISITDITKIDFIALW